MHERVQRKRIRFSFCTSACGPFEFNYTHWRARSAYRQRAAEKERETSPLSTVVLCCCCCSYQCTTRMLRTLMRGSIKAGVSLWTILNKNFFISSSLCTAYNAPFIQTQCQMRTICRWCCAATHSVSSVSYWRGATEGFHYNCRRRCCWWYFAIAELCLLCVSVHSGECNFGCSVRSSTSSMKTFFFAEQNRILSV